VPLLFATVGASVWLPRLIVSTHGRWAHIVHAYRSDIDRVEVREIEA
jgi:hypothetical protein